MRVELNAKDEETIGQLLIFVWVIVGAIFISRTFWLAESTVILPSSLIMFLSAIISLAVIPALIITVSAIRDLVVSLGKRAA